MNNKNIELDNLLHDVESLVEKAEQKQPYGAVTLWLPMDYKDKYSHLQEITDRKFAGKARELFMNFLDKVDL